MHIAIDVEEISSQFVSQHCVPIALNDSAYDAEHLIHVRENWLESYQAIETLVDYWLELGSPGSPVQGSHHPMHSDWYAVMDRLVESLGTND